MHDILPEVARLRATGKPVALATVVHTTGSVPRPAGSSMAMTPDGDIAGSISGGCLEADVYEEAMLVLEQRKPKLLHYGITEEMAYEVGLSCGGEVDIFVQPLDDW